MVGAAGFEPATPWSQTRYSSQAEPHPATIEGQIGFEEKGTNGFGYDPIFYVPEFGKTTAELTEEEKNQVSHRGKALELMKKELMRYEESHCSK